MGRVSGVGCIPTREGGVAFFFLVATRMASIACSTIPLLHTSCARRLMMCRGIEGTGSSVKDRTMMSGGYLERSSASSLGKMIKGKVGWGDLSSSWPCMVSFLFLCVMACEWPVETPRGMTSHAQSTQANLPISAQSSAYIEQGGKGMLSHLTLDNLKHLGR